MYVWFFFFKQKTAYEMRISDWSSDVCSSDLIPYAELFGFDRVRAGDGVVEVDCGGAWLRFTTAETLGRLHPGLIGAPRLPTPWLAALRVAVEIGRASCRERVCQYV